MVDRRGARLRLQGAVADNMERDDSQRARGQRALGGDSCPQVDVSPFADPRRRCLGHEGTVRTGCASTAVSFPSGSAVGPGVASEVRGLEVRSSAMNRAIRPMAAPSPE